MSPTDLRWLTAIVRSLGAPVLAGFVAACAGNVAPEDSTAGAAYLDLDKPGWLGTNANGQCAYNGSIAVDQRTGTAFTRFVVFDGTCTNGGTTMQDDLLAAPRDSTRAVRVMDLDGRSDVRILFPKDSVLVMWETPDPADWTIYGPGRAPDTLTFLDPKTLDVRHEMERPVQYDSAWLSPSTRYVAANPTIENLESSDVHLIDVNAYTVTTLSEAGNGIAWANQSDVLFTWKIHGKDESGPGMSELRLRAFGRTDGTFQPSLDVRLGDVAPDLFAHRIAVSPDDRYLVLHDVPRRERMNDGGVGDAPWPPRLHVVDVMTEEVQTIEAAVGPVGFLPESSALVAWKCGGRHTPSEDRRVGPWEDAGAANDAGKPIGDADASSREPTPESDPASDQAEQPCVLLVIDLETLAETSVPIPERPAFVTTGGGQPVVVSWLDEALVMVVYDVETKRVVSLPYPSEDEECGSCKRHAPNPSGLDEFVVREQASELYLVDYEGLFRLDYGDEPSLEPVDPGFRPAHINLLRDHDELVLDDPVSSRIRFVDPDRLETVHSVKLLDPE